MHQHHNAYPPSCLAKVATCVLSLAACPFVNIFVSETYDLNTKVLTPAVLMQHLQHDGEKYSSVSGKKVCHAVCICKSLKAGQESASTFRQGAAVLRRSSSRLPNPAQTELRIRAAANCWHSSIPHANDSFRQHMHKTDLLLCCLLCCRIR